MAFVTLQQGTILYRGAEYSHNPYTSRDDCDIIYFARDRKTAEIYAKLVDGKSKGYIWVYKTLKPITLLCFYDSERPMFHDIILNILKELLHKYIDKKRDEEYIEDSNDKVDVRIGGNTCKDEVDVNEFTADTLIGIAESFGLEDKDKTTDFKRSSFMFYDLVMLKLLFASEFGREFRAMLKEKFRQFAECNVRRKVTEKQRQQIEESKAEARAMMDMCDKYIGYQTFEWPTGVIVNGEPQVFHEELCFQKQEGLIECIQSYKISNGSAVPFRCKEVVKGGSRRKGIKKGGSTCPFVDNNVGVPTIANAVLEETNSVSGYFNRVLTSGSDSSHFTEIMPI